ncbi:MAG: hypothetical protein ACLFPX_04210 [Candidatus Omnitrophota bacterium]
MMTILPFLISGLLGCLILKNMAWTIFRRTSVLFLSLSLGLGLAVSAYVAFSSFLIFDQLNTAFVLWTHTVLSAAFMLLTFRRWNRRGRHLRIQFSRESLLKAGLFSLLGLVIWSGARTMPHGGWDAWQVWNFKARFLLLADQGQWHNMFLPELWRNSPHYPLLLPLINVWVWIFAGAQNLTAPLSTAITLTLMVGGLTFGTVRMWTKNLPAAVLTVLLIFSSFHYLRLSFNQYCEVVVSFYLLAGLACAILAQRKNKAGMNVLAGIFLGILPFSKPEGLVAAGLALLIIPWICRPRQTSLIKNTVILWAAALAAAVPSIIFILWLSPGNQTMINGLLSAGHPSTWLRLKIILAFFGMEIIHPKWTGLWLLFILGVLFSGLNGLRRPLSAFGLFLLGYLSIIILYYWINTYFEIYWWLGVSLSRILSSLLPLMATWSVCSLFSPKK